MKLPPKKILFNARMVWKMQKGSEKQPETSPKNLKPLYFGDRDRRGQNVLNARRLEGGGTRPESCPSKTWTSDSQIEDFLEHVLRKGSISVTTEYSKHLDPSTFWRFDPPYPSLQVLLLKNISPELL